MLYTLRFFFSSKCSLFHKANLFGSCIIHILYTGVLKLKNNSGAKGSIYRLVYRSCRKSSHHCIWWPFVMCWVADKPKVKFIHSTNLIEQNRKYEYKCSRIGHTCTSAKCIFNWNIEVTTHKHRRVWLPPLVRVKLVLVSRKTTSEWATTASHSV